MGLPCKETALRQELEKKDEEEEKSEDEKDKTKDKEGKDDEETEEYDEEEHEEESDYISSCFEDGHDFGAVSDDNTDEATY